MVMLVKAWSGRGGHWIGEPRRLDATPITSIEDLAAYVEWNGHVLLYIWAAGESQQREAPKLINVSFIESWEECGFDDVVRSLPTRRRGLKKPRPSPAGGDPV